MAFRKVLWDPSLVRPVLQCNRILPCYLLGSNQRPCLPQTGSQTNQQARLHILLLCIPATFLLLLKARKRMCPW